jgi:hypothetical protein
MKAKIIDNMVQGAILWALAFFGLRGVLPDIAAAGDLPLLFLGAAASIVGFAVGPYAYEAYRCAQTCESTCDPSFCRA